MTDSKTTGLPEAFQDSVTDLFAFVDKFRDVQRSDSHSWLDTTDLNDLRELIARVENSAVLEVSSGAKSPCPECAIRKARQFPIMRGPILSIPWLMIEPHEYQARMNHDQTLDVLAKRGGLSASEALAVLEDRKWRNDPDAGMKLREKVEAFERGYAVRAQGCTACVSGRISWPCGICGRPDPALQLTREPTDAEVDAACSAYDAALAKGYTDLDVLLHHALAAVLKPTSAR